MTGLAGDRRGVRPYEPAAALPEERARWGDVEAAVPAGPPPVIVSGLTAEELAHLRSARGVEARLAGDEALVWGPRDAVLAAIGPLGEELRQEAAWALAAFEPPPETVLDLRGRRLRLGRRVAIMGILNVTPDSFSDGGRYLDPQAAVARAEEMLAEGADIVDIGGESTRPGHTPVSADEELRRILPVVGRVVELGAIVSVDTSKAPVAREALAAGAHLINDVWGFLRDPDLPAAVAEAGAGAVLMHNQPEPVYRDLMGDVLASLRRSLRIAREAGVDRGRILLDPGIGFGKTAAHSQAVLRRLRELRSLGCPLLVGPSRKSFLGRHLAPLEREDGTAAAVTLAIAYGAACVRVHNVRRMAQVARAAELILYGPEASAGA